MNLKGNRTLILILASIASFLTPFMGSAVNISLPAIGRAFSMNAIMLNWVSTSYLIASAVLILPFGRAADLFGKKRIFLPGTVIFTVSTLLVAFSTTGEALIFFRVLQGLGSSMIFGTGTAILVEAYPQEERGRALGINVAATYLGLTLGPFLGGVLTGSFGWGSVFLVNVPVGLVILGIGALVIEERKEPRKKEKMDLPGSAIYSASLVAIMYGFSRISSGMGIWLTLAGTAGLALFVCREKMVESPVLDIRLLTRNRQFAFSNLATFIHYSATFAVTFLMSLYLQEVKAMTPQKAGLILVSQPFVMMALSPLAGRLSDRVEPRILASAGMGVTCLGLVLLAFLHAGSDLTTILVPLVIVGLGFAFFSSPNTNAVMSAVPRKTYGTASGMIATMRLTGQTASMGIVLILFAVFIGQNRIMPEVHEGFMASMRSCCVIFAVLCAIGAVASLARGSMREKER